MRGVERALVLIAEEHGAVRSLYALTLRDAGFETVEAGSCEAAYHLAVSCRPHLVLAACDSTLDGLDLAERLARDAVTRTIPVILLAGAGHEDPSLVADSTWTHIVLPKPCPTGELIEHVRQAAAYSMELRQILSLSAPATIPAASTVAAAPAAFPPSEPRDLPGATSNLRTL
jgi:two-component system, OmpR family, phosphate regulon response regulator PhoB